MSANIKALATRWFEEVWNQRRTETVHELFSPEGIGHMEGMEIKGPEPFLQLHAAFIQAFPDLKLEVEDVIAEGNSATIRWFARGTHHGDGLGVEPTGKATAFRGMTWLRFENDILVEGWDCWNQGALMQNLSTPA